MGGKIISRQTVKAYRKDVTAKLTEEMLLENEITKEAKSWKKRMKNMGKFEVPQMPFFQS